MTETPAALSDAFQLRPAADATLIANLDGAFSNGPEAAPPEAGFPFGGLLAALCAGAMRQGLALQSPLRSLTVQYLAAARFGQPVWFRPRLLRGGRNVTYAVVEAGQTTSTGERLTHHGSATFGAASESLSLAALAAPPPPRDSLDAARQLEGPMKPRFTAHVEYCFEDGPNILGGKAGQPAVERVWLRTRDGLPLDEMRLCYLLDALYPPAWVAFKAPPMMTTVDLRYDILAELTPATAPDGWVFFEFRLLDLGGGWCVDEATAWSADGVPLALARQRRKLL